MFTWISMFEIVMLSASAGAAGALGPGITTCEEFESGAYFNPYEVVDSMWKIFYFWANTSELYPIIFSLPAKKRLDKIKALVEAAEPGLNVEWHKAVLLMEPRPGVMAVLLYGGTPGAFRALVKIDQRTQMRPHPLPLIKLADIRLKLVGDYMGMMCCEDLTGYVLARVDEVPSTEQECEKAALKLGINLPNGRSYLPFKRIADEL